MAQMMNAQTLVQRVHGELSVDLWKLNWKHGGSQIMSNYVNSDSYLGMRVLRVLSRIIILVVRMRMMLMILMILDNDD